MYPRSLRTDCPKYGITVLLCDLLRLSEHPLDDMRGMKRLLRHKMKRGNRLPDQLVIQIFGLAEWNHPLLLSREKLHDDPDHQPQKRRPDQSHDDIETGMGIGNLSGNDIYLIALRRDHRDQIRVGLYKPDEQQTAAHIKDTVRKRRPLCVDALADTCQNGCDRRSDIITQKNRYCSRKPDDACNPVCGWLRRKILKNRNCSAGALHHKGHHQTRQNTQHRNMGDLPNQVNKEGTGSQGFHHAAHDLDSLKQKPESQDGISDVFDLLLLRGKSDDKADENDDKDIITQLERNDLSRHGRSDICAEND